MVARLLWEQDVGSSSLFTSTRLSLDAIRVPGPAFSFALPLAFAAGIFLSSKPRLSLDAICVPGFCFNMLSRNGISQGEQ